MNYSKNYDENFIKDLMKDFTAATSIGCFLLSNDGEILLDSPPDTKKCEYCRFIGKSCKRDVECSRYHLYGMQEARRHMPGYVYFCPSGLAHFAAPVVLGEDVLFSLIGGPVLILDREDFILSDVMKNEQIPARYRPEVKSFLLEKVVVTPERVKSLASTLALFSSAVAGNEKSRQEEKNAEELSPLEGYLKQLCLLTGRRDLSLPYPEGEERELMSSISDSDREKTLALLSSFAKSRILSEQNLENARESAFDLLLLLSRAAIEAGVGQKEVLDLNAQHFKELKTFKKVDALFSWILKATDGFFELLFGFTDIRHKDVILKAISFIRTNYMARLTLDDVASHVYLSSSYLSKIFKEDTGQNLNSYLNAVRIEKSKDMLLSTALSLSDISERCGFEDQSYFSKVFKKSTGFSPGRFRETRGKAAS